MNNYYNNKGTKEITFKFRFIKSTSISRNENELNVYLENNRWKV